MRLLFPSSLIRLGLIAVTFPAPAWSQALPASEQPLEVAEAPVELDPVTVVGQRSDEPPVLQPSTATRLDLSLRETPQSVSVIELEQIQDFQLNTVNQLLNQVTGVQVEQVETDRTYYTVRGFDVTNFQVDGVGTPLTYGNAEGDVATALYERVEVVRGANGLMSGAGNPSATINFIRKRPTAGYQTSVSAGAGSWSRIQVDADAAGPLSDRARGRLVISHQDGESYLDDYAKALSVIYATTEWDLSERTLLSVGASQQRSQADSPLWGALPLYYSDGSATDYDPSTSTAADWAFWNTDETQAFVELAQELGSDWDVEATYTHSRIDGESELFYMYGVPDRATEAGLFGYASAYDLSDEKDLIDLYASGGFAFAGRRHDLVLGVNAFEVRVSDRSAYDDVNGFPVIDDFSQWTGDIPRPEFTRSNEADGSQWTDQQVAAYAATRLHLGEALSVIGGLRVVNWESEGESYGEAQDSTETGVVLPYAGVVLKATEAVSLYTSYGETFQPQADLDVNLTRLEPAQGRNLEAGIKAGLMDERLILSAAVFEARHEGVSEYFGFDVERGVSVYEGRDYESRGYELELTGRLARHWYVSAGYTDLSVDTLDSGAERLYVPEQLLRVSAAGRLPALPKLKLGAAIDWQSDIERDQGGGVTTRQDAYGLVSAFVAYSFNDHWSAALNGYNLSDEKYLTTLYWSQGYYGAPRNLLATITWRY